MLGENYAIIPWETEVMTLIVMPMDKDEEPLWDEAIQFELDYISELPQDVEPLDYSQSTWAPIKRFGTDFYPSYVLATSTWSQDIEVELEDTPYSLYGDKNGYFGIQLSQFPIGSIVRVEIEGEPLAKRSSYTITVTMEGINEIYPVMEYDYEALKAVN